MILHCHFRNKNQTETQAQTTRDDSSTILVDVPRHIPPSGVWWSLRVDEKTWQAHWNARLATLQLRPSNGNRLETNLRLRHKDQPIEQDELVHARKLALAYPGKNIQIHSSVGVSQFAAGALARLSKANDRPATIKAPMTGKVLAVLKELGARVEKGDCLLVIEAMKMENQILAPLAGIVSDLRVTAGAQAEVGQVLATVTQQTV